MVVTARKWDRANGKVVCDEQNNKINLLHMAVATGKGTEPTGK